MLSVPRDADADAIQKAFKKCALKCHPDKNPAPGAEGEPHSTAHTQQARAAGAAGIAGCCC